ncbi:putative glutathione S-transferase GSTU6 [Dichanthelium oligosanthes]|uniref:glutathione transferase n=1 Tax=Dichanthelium oligosanthes TaxID=888268 RepID=A0A1E5V7G6_9POAL|nr:putative glutathione S-transferase GSTU6 [Dichanthelium oligosanthes]
MAEEDELKLLGMWASPFVLRARLALSFKGLRYEYVEEEIFGNKSELLLKSNPVHKKVPVLIHNGKPICESQIIVQYIDEVCGATGPPLLPFDPYDRAVARFWASYIDDKMFSSFMMMIMGNTAKEKAEGMGQLFAAAETLEGALKECSKGKPFFGGDSVGYVDIALGGFVAWVHTRDRLSGLKHFDADKTPLLAAWLERFDALNETKAVMPDVEKLVELSKKRQAQADAAAAVVQGDELKLLGFWGSPFVLRARLALSFKGLSYEYVEEDLKNKSELLVKSNPVHKKVPVLIHNGKPICETQVIVQYLDEVYGANGPSLLPVDPYDRAMARFWAAYIDDKLLSSFMMMSMGKTDEERAEGRKQSFAAAEILEDALKECSKGRQFFGGDSVGYVDIVLGGFVAWLHLIDRSTGSKQFDAGRTPLLAAWLEHFGSLDAAKAVMPDLERLVGLSKMRQAQ